MPSVQPLQTGSAMSSWVLCIWSFTLNVFMFPVVVWGITWQINLMATIN